MLRSGISASIAPAHPPFSQAAGESSLPENCRIWQGLPLGASSGSAAFDTCSLSTVSITEQKPWSSYITDDYFLVFAEMCGNGEVIAEINTAPSNGGWAGLEVREDTSAGARKYGMRTITGTVVQLFTRNIAGQAASFSSLIKPPHKWLKISRYGSLPGFSGDRGYDPVGKWRMWGRASGEYTNCAFPGRYACYISGTAR